MLQSRTKPTVLRLFSSTSRRVAAYSTTSDESAQSTPSGSAGTFNPKATFEGPRGRFNSGTAFVRPWARIESVADAFAIVRGVERAYGRIREFKFLRDYELPDTYQFNIYVKFEDVESASLIPPEATVLHIPAPSVNLTRPGGIGLDELTQRFNEPGSEDNLRPSSSSTLLDPADRSNDVNDMREWGSVMRNIAEASEARPGEKKKGRIIDVRVERAQRPYYTPSRMAPPPYNPGRLRATAHSFVAWGGFSALRPEDPLPESSPSSRLRVDRTDPQFHMRLALHKWNNLRGRIQSSEKSARLTDSRQDLPVGDAAGSSETTVSKVEQASLESKARTDPRDEIPWEPLPGAQEDSVLDLPSTPTVLHQTKPIAASAPISVVPPLPDQTDTPAEVEAEKQEHVRAQPVVPTKAQKQSVTAATPKLNNRLGNNKEANVQKRDASTKNKADQQGKAKKVVQPQSVEKVLERVKERRTGQARKERELAAKEEVEQMLNAGLKDRLKGLVGKWL